MGYVDGSDPSLLCCTVSPPLSFACKARVEASVPLFKAFLTVGLLLEFIFVKETLISYLHPDLITDICHGQGSLAYPYPKEPFDEALWNRIPGQSASVAGEGSKRRCSIIESLKKEAIVVKIMPKKKKLEVPRRMSTRGNVPSPPATVPKGIGKHPWVLAHFVGSLANSSDSLAPGFLSFNELVDVFDVHALQTTVVGNMLTNESRILSQGHAKIKNDLVSLKSKKSSLEHEMSKLKDRLAKAQRK
ncbi:hypothetical protein Tco_0363574 [Tanacetum coccineum]